MGDHLDDELAGTSGPKNSKEHKESGQSKKQKEIIDLKMSLGSILLDIQKDYESQGKLLTAENAMKALQDHLKQKFNTKTLLERLAVLLGKEKVTFDDVSGIEIDGYKSLKREFSKKYEKHMDLVNKRGTVSSYTSMLTKRLHVPNKSIQGIGSYIKSQKLLPQYNAETKRRELGSKQYAGLPTWNQNYFVVLRDLVDEYVGYVQENGTQDDYENIISKLGKTKLSIGSIVNHCKEIGLYTTGSVPSDFVIQGGTKKGTGVKAYNKKLKQSIDPRNLVSGILDVHIELESDEILYNRKQQKIKVLDAFANKGGDLNSGLQARYPLESFTQHGLGKDALSRLESKYIRTSGEEGSERRTIALDETFRSERKLFQKTYYTRIQKEAIKAGNDHDESLAHAMVLVASGVTVLSESKLLSLKKVAMKELRDSKLTATQQSGLQAIIKETLQGKFPDLPEKEIIRRLQLQQQFWLDFYNLDNTEHTLVDGAGNTMNLSIHKELKFHPNAAENAGGLSDMFSLSLAYKPTLGEEGNYKMMAVAAKEDVRSFRHSIKTTSGQELLLQKSQQYTIKNQSGEIEAEGYPMIDIIDGDDAIDSPSFRRLVILPRPFNSYALDKYTSGEGSDRCFDPTKIPGAIVVGEEKEGGEDLLNHAVKNFTFDPIGELAFRVELDMQTDYDAHNKLISKHFARLEKIQLASMVELNEQVKQEKSVYTPNQGLNTVMRKSERIKRRYLKSNLVTSNETPEELRKNADGAMVNAWIENGEIFLNNDYFKEEHDLDLFSVPSFSQGKIDANDVLNRARKAANDPIEFEKRMIIVLEIRRRTNHEKAHRVFHYYDIVDGHDHDHHHDHSEAHDHDHNHEEPSHGAITLTDSDGNIVVLSNESLSVIAEGAVFLNQSEERISKIPGLHRHLPLQDGTGRHSVVVVQQGKQYTIIVEELEAEIAKKIPGFTFAKIHSIDTAVLEKVYKNNEQYRFDDLLEARAGNVENSTDPINLVDVQANADNTFVVSGHEDQAILSENNVIGIRTATNEGTNFVDADFDANDPNNPIRTIIDQDIEAIRAAIRDGRNVVLPYDQTNNRFNIGNAEFNDNADSEQIRNYLNQQLGGLAAYADEEDENDEPEQPNPQPPVPAPTPEQPIPQQPMPEQPEEDQIESQRAMFDNEFRNLEGDDSIGEPANGVVMFLKDGNSLRPGKNSDWAKVTIVDASRDNELVLEFSGHTEKDAGQFVGTRFTIPRTEEGFSDLKRRSKGEIRKYKPISAKDDFVQYAKQQGADARGQVNGRSKEYIIDGKTETAPVTHVAYIPPQVGPYELSNAVYEVNRENDGVYLSTDTKDGKKIATKMDYTSFLQFMNDKKLSPYTEEEIKRSGKYKRKGPKETGAPKFSRVDGLIAISTIVQAVKKIPETFKSKMEQEQKLQAGEFYNRLLKKIPGGIDGGLLFIDDIKADAIAEQDATVMQIIDDYKSKLNRSDIGEGMHANMVTGIIVDEIFNKKITRKRDRLKAAGYLLFALESGGHPYFSQMAAHNGEGLWIKAVLGDEHQKDYQQEKKQLTDQYRSMGMSSDEIQDKLAKLEIDYISSRCFDHPFYGTRFGRKVEEHRDKRGKIDAIDGVKSSVAAKGNIYYIYEALKLGGIKQIKPHVFLGGLEALEDSVEDSAHYSIFYQSIVMAMMSGYTKMFSKSYMDRFKGICRRRGIPIGMFASDPASARKSVDVIDYIAKKAGIKKGLGAHIKGKVGSWNPDALTADNFAKSTDGSMSLGSTQHTQVINAVESWWSENGYIIMDAFNYQNTLLLEGLTDDDPAIAKTGIKGSIESYFSGDAVFNSYRNYDRGNVREMPDGDNPFYDGIFNLAPGTFKSYMLDFRGDDFATPQMADMREKFAGSVGGFEKLVRNAQDKEPFLGFLLKKFKLYFGPDIGKTSMGYMQSVLSTSDTDATTELENIINLHIVGNRQYEEQPDGRVVRGTRNYGATQRGVKHSVVSSALHQYVRILADNIRDLPQATRNRLVKQAFQ